ncbi:MAG: hypothetical protein MJ105_08775 [Lachnospiraceae bacterium]|nr:hypothetical protein [Lachnospiraceae bacterium]
MKLISYNSSESGGMNGSYSSTSIAYTDDGRCEVNTANRPFHSQPIRRVRYYAEGLLEKLSEVCERYDVIHWTDLPQQKVTMYDAPSGSDCFVFDNGTKIVLESGMIYTQQIRDMYDELKPLIKVSENYGVDVMVTEEPGIMTMGMMFGQTNRTVEVKCTSGKDEDMSTWAKFCDSCGANFTGNQKFCAECGSPRKKG